MDLLAPNLDWEEGHTRAEALSSQRAALHHQHAVLHGLIQWVGKEHLHVHRLLHPGLIQHLQGEGLTESGLDCSSHLPLKADGAVPETWSCFPQIGRAHV